MQKTNNDQRAENRIQRSAAVFLDRDGTLIPDLGYLEDPEAVTLLPGVAEALLQLADAGFKLILVTNQSGVGRGFFGPDKVHEQHEVLKRHLARHGVVLDDIAVCFHAPEDDCRCRKPRPDMLLDAAERCGIELQRSFMAGDKPSDIQAGKAAGCTTILLGEQYCPEADYVVRDMTEAVPVILQSGRRQIALNTS